MTMHSLDAGGVRRRAASHAQIVEHWIARFRERSRVRRDMAKLAELPDHLLRDMGLEGHVERRKRPLPPTWL